MIVVDQEQLRQPCEEVKLEEADSLIKTLEEELRQSNLRGQPGIGLAAPQIGINKKIAIIRIPSSEPINLNLINAKILNGYDTKIVEEGCLSFPDLIVKKRRFTEIHAQTGIGMYMCRFICTGLAAQAIQHELEHLEGVLLIDNVIK